MPPARNRRTHDIGPLWRRRHGGPVRKLCVTVGAGCPNRDGRAGRGGCIYCAEGPRRSAAPPLDDQIARGLARLQRGTAVVGYLQDHSATDIAPGQLQRVLETLARVPGLVGITVGTRPDCLGPEVMEVLARARSWPNLELTVELGLQSAREETLELLNRGHDLDCFRTAIDGLQRAGMRTCAHVILGLPTPAASPDALAVEDVDHAIGAARLLGELQITAVKIHNCHVLRGTALARLYEAGRYRPPDEAGYLRRLVPFLEHLLPSVEIHRLVGEARPPALLAPAFTAHKARTVARIRAELERRDTWQGRCAARGA